MKTTYPIELKFTGLIEWVNKNLNNNSQSILIFIKILKYLNLRYMGVFYGLEGIHIN